MNRINNLLGISGEGCDLLQFRLVWHHRTLDVGQQVKIREECPSARRTEPDIPTLLPSQRLTRIHTPGPREWRICHILQNKLGRGTFGMVWGTWNFDTGDLIAVKMIEPPELEFKATELQSWKREIEALASISHIRYLFPIYSQHPLTSPAKTRRIHFVSTGCSPIRHLHDFERTQY